MRFELLASQEQHPQKNMDKDASLLQSLENDPRVILHLYAWPEKSATHGYFIDPYKLLRRERVETHGMVLGRRPTGGGVIFHQYDLAFAILIPSIHPQFSLNTLDNYAVVNTVVAETIKSFKPIYSDLALLKNNPSCHSAVCRQFCMAQPTIYDVMLEGKKVVGGAQRRTKHGLLHQGSIALTLPEPGYLEEMMIEGVDIISAMRESSYYLLGEGAAVQEIQYARRELQHLLAKEIKSQMS